MKSEIVFGVSGALATGVAIGLQATLNSRNGSVLNPIRSGLLTNIVGGVMAGLVLLLYLTRQDSSFWQIPHNVKIMLIAAGTLGVGIVVGISYSLQLTGITAGLATVILGQLLISTIVDASGWGGVEPIPINARRILGLLVMAVAVYLLLPRD